MIDVKIVYVTPELLTNILSVKNSKGSELLNLLYQNGHLIGDEGEAVIHILDLDIDEFHVIVDSQPFVTSSTLTEALLNLFCSLYVCNISCNKQVLNIFLFLQRVLFTDSLPNTPTLIFFVKEIEKKELS